MSNNFMEKKNDLLKVFLTTYVQCGAQLGNYTLKIIQMTLDIFTNFS